MRPTILSTLSFIKYGNIVRQEMQTDNDTGYTNRTVQTDEDIQPTLWRYEHPVFLDPIDGVGLIAVTESLDLTPETFLLDKHIYVNPGIWFTVLPYGCTYTYRISEKGKRSEGRSKKLITPKGIPSNIRVNKIYTIFYQEKERNFSFKGERHPYWELTYVDKGVLYCKVEDKEYELKQGDFIFFAGNQYHSQHSKKDDIVSFLTISFDFDSFDYDLLYNRVFKADIKLRELMKSILAEHMSHRLYSEDMIPVLLTQIVIEATRNKEMNDIAGSLPTPQTEETRDKITCELLKLIDEGIGESMTVHSLSTKMCISPSSLSKTFKQHTGVSIMKYIRERRMEMAKELIKSGKYTITQISDMLGYCSISYFSSEFKKRHDFSPREYSRAINQ